MWILIMQGIYTFIENRKRSIMDVKITTVWLKFNGQGLGFSFSISFDTDEFYLAGGNYLMKLNQF